MTERNNRIRAAIDERSSQQKVAERLGISRQAVNLRLSGEKDIDSIEFLNAVNELTGYSMDYLINGSVNIGVPETPTISHVNEERGLAYMVGKNIRPVTVTVAPSGKELMTYVPVKAQAGYKRGFGDPHFIETLPAFNLPLITSQKTTRMFQVDGNSMRQVGGGGLTDSDIVIAEYVEDFYSIKDGRVYVIVSTEGILVKRCINRLKEEGKRVLVCNSDNKDGGGALYPPIILHPNEILEVWELKAYISRQLSFNTDLWETLNDLQVNMSLIQDKLKLLESGKK